MWKYWIVIVVGIVFILIPFLGLTTFLFKFTMMIGGFLVTVFGFWILSLEKIKKSNVGQEIREFQR